MTRTTPPRARYTESASGMVTLTYWDDRADAMVTREFTAKGGQVREYDSRGNVLFVGPRLMGGGWSLAVHPDGLLATIRREYRALQRAERKAWGL